jgi:hypothetical protein
MADNGTGRNAPLVDLLEAPALQGFQAGCVALKLVDSSLTSSTYFTTYRFLRRPSSSWDNRTAEGTHPSKAQRLNPYSSSHLRKAAEWYISCTTSV